ncbi:RNA-directed DNA polymerase, eukaryota [Tanacetum coccineum]
MDSISDMEIKFLWGNSLFEASISEAIGNSGGILCVWDPNVFSKSNHVVSDNFVAVYGNWIPNNMDLLIISVYAPQSIVEKRTFWNFISSLISRWNGEYIVFGDFNEVRFERERIGSIFNQHGANVFNSFILNSSLVDVQLEGYAFTWAHPSAAKMSKLDRFLVSEGLISIFPHMSAICLDRHLSDHRPILLRDVIADFGAIPFRLYNSWLDWDGFGSLVSNIWNSTILIDRNGMVRFIKKLQILKKEIRLWNMSMRKKQSAHINDIKTELRTIDATLDQGGVTDELLLARMDLMKKFHDSKSYEVRDQIQKAKIKWAIEGDENSSFMLLELEKPVSCDEIRDAVWDCGTNKSPGPDGFSFEFFRKFWDVIGPDMCVAVEWFFSHNTFTRGCNSSFISLIPKIHDPKFVSDYRPISLIGSLYKVVTKILSRRLSFVISDLISDVQTAFLPKRQILDGPFVIDELLSCNKARLSKWKVRTLSIGGRLTLLKSVLGSTPIYSMSMYKAPKSVLNKMEALRRDFFNGVQGHDRKIAWIKWAKVLLQKKEGG